MKASYVDNALVDGETVIARAYYHWLSWAPAALALTVPLLIQIASWALVDAGVRAWLNYLTYGLIILGAFYFLWDLIRIRSTEVAVTDRRFIRKTGWISRNTNEIELRSIEEVGLRQSVWGRLLGYGELTVRGTGAGVVVSPGLDDPKAFRNALQLAQQRLRERYGLTTPAGPPPQVIS